ncbi:hypothetical protein [Actinophytocola xanthii]|uniref:DUF1579 domain-containing protein n=1 Tax=Actinophytocola xanthii TaxID=1912961 RepID=A0A1Q8CGR5_9PSEU|nr:hypothetical protein [Actinophytocola xanthii]OLF13546.1 hypothetical protein BU204_26985 [Actinophytocola xanthii]
MNDFDFLTGTWNVANRRLTTWLVGSDEWDEFPGEARALSVWGGAANFDEITFPTRGYSGLTLRLYDREREEWSIHWSNSRTGQLDVPVVGRFGSDGVGTFFADEQHEGRPVRLRFIWSNITATTARWEQAYSPDGERTWETNWVMDFTRK